MKKDVFVSFTIHKEGAVEGFLSSELAPSQEVGRAVMRLMLPSVGAIVWEKKRGGQAFVGKLRVKDLQTMMGGMAATAEDK